MRKAWILALVAAVAAGCAEPGPAAATDEPPTAEGLVSIDLPVVEGIVLDEARVPIAGAAIHVAETNGSAVTDAQGGFAVQVEAMKVHTVRASAPGHLARTLFTTPELAPLEFILPVDVAAVAPYNQTIELDGHFDCAVDTLIIPGSCTAVLAFGGVDEPIFSEAGNFTFPIEPGWATVVFDFVSEEQPGLEGMRLVVRGGADSEALNSYQQYARFGGTPSFTARLEPGQTYPDGVEAVPANLTALQVDVYPQGHMYHDACVPPGPEGTCFTGLGAGSNLEFRMLVTVFYVAPAPDGFTLQRA